MELDKEITKIKLKGTDKLIEKGGTSFLNKEERQVYDSREDQFVTEQKELKQKEKSGIPFRGSTPIVTPSESPVENKEEDAKKKSYDSAELAAMSSASLKNIKLENNSAITKRKMTLKTRSNFLTPKEKADLQLEVDDLLKQVELIDAELKKNRNLITKSILK